MQLGQQISIPEITALGLGAIEADLGASEMRREIKIYKVPQAVSADQYFVSVTDAGAVENAPPSRSKETLLLAEYTLESDGNILIKYQHEELEDA